MKSFLMLEQWLIRLRGLQESYLAIWVNLPACSEPEKIEWSFPICLKLRAQCLVLLPFANLDYELWLPPDRTKFHGVLVSDSNNSVISVSNNCSLGDILVLTCRSQGLSIEHLLEATHSCDIILLTWLVSSASYKSCSCSTDNKYVVVVQLMAHYIGDLIGSAQKYMTGSLLILGESEQCTNNSSYGIKHRLPPLCTSTSRALMMLLFEWPFPSSREFLAGAIILSVAVACMTKMCSALPFSAGMRCSGFLGSLLHSSYHQVPRNRIDKGSNIQIAWLPVLRILSHDSYELDGMTNKFEQLAELGLSMSWDPGGRCATVLTAFIDHDYYHDDASSFDLIQVHLNIDCYREGYHRDSSNTKERHVSWDPGGNSTSSAWGQAEF